MDRLSVNFCGLKFENPFVLAASPCTDELEMVMNGFRAGWAGAVLKTTHLESSTFNVRPVSPRVAGYDFEDKKMVGLASCDVISKYDVGVVEERVRELKREFPNKLVMVSVAAINKETFHKVIKPLVAAGADAIECSTACPQGHIGLEAHRLLSEDPVAVAEMVTWAKEAADSAPVFVKLSGLVDQVANSRAVKAAGGDADAVASC